MNAEIIAVGTELLLGQIVNTNARFLSVELSQLGINVYFQSVVGDNPERLKTTLVTALNRADLVVLTGGLGPTKDDLTKETIASVLGLPLELDTPSLEKMRDFFKKMKRNMASNNEKQAYMPKGCMILTNDHGTAPGCLIEKDQKIVIMLPGPPSEMEPMFKNYVYPYLLKKTDEIIYSKVLRVFGIGESSVEEKLIDIIDNQTNPTVAPYAKQGEVTLRITAKCSDELIAKTLIDPVEKEIRSRLGTCVYGIEEELLEEVVGKLLIESNLTISTAESCTGGMLAGKLTSIPGISSCFHSGFITYSNEAKQELLGVSGETLEKYGAVSAQTAVEMAEGVRKKSMADIGISITGIAGPGGGTSEKPVGLVYIGLSTKEGTEYKELHLAGNRERIRNLTTMNALDVIRRYLIAALTE